MRVRTAADLMRKGDPAHGSLFKPLAVDQYAFRRAAVFVRDKANEITIIFVHCTNTRGKGCFTAVAPLRKL